MSANWFKNWFNSQLYLDLYKHRDNKDAKKIVSLITKNISLPKSSKVLDLACGNGRHSVLFAKKGYKVTGVDLSEYLIRQARNLLKSDYSESRSNLEFEIRDMRHISYRNKFDLVVNLFSSFGYFDKDSENFSVIKGISKSLKKNGYFFLDFLNADFLSANLVPFDISTRNDYVIIQVRNIKSGFVTKQIFFIRNSGSKKSAPLINNYFEKIRLYSLEDFRKMFKKAGLNIIKTYGNYRGEKYSKNKSERLIILAKKI